jgi:hypothetical protein
MWLLILQLFKNRIHTQGKLRLNLHSLSVSELLEYGRKKWWAGYEQFVDIVHILIYKKISHKIYIPLSLERLGNNV